ncbi:MAG: transporter [Candidatus Brocadia sp.]|nr:transporter [Candidatus Brocadia sp.]
MRHCISVLLWLLTSWICISTAHSFAGEEKAQSLVENTHTGETLTTHAEHHGLKRDLGFSNFLEGWLTPWQPYAEDEIRAPRVPLLRITPAFFKREVRFNYIYIDDEHQGEADVSEFAFALELPLTLRFKVDIEPKVLHVNTVEDSDNVGFGDTRLALRGMLLENDKVSLSTGSVINIPTGDGDRELGEEITTLGQQLACWIDLGHRMSLHTFLGVDVPTGGNDREDADMNFLYGVALSKTFTIKENPCIHGITPFIELNGHKEFGLDKSETQGEDEGGHAAETESEHEAEGIGEKYMVDILPGVRFDLPHELYVLAGFEIPLNGTEEFDKRIWFSIIKDF